MSASPSCSPQRDRRRSASRVDSPQQTHGRERSTSPPRGRPMSICSSPQSPDQRGLSPSHSPSPSLPIIGRKRVNSFSDDHLHHLVKAQKVSEGGGRPKASDYDDVAKEVILCATAIYRCLVSTSNAFPTPSEEGELIKCAWNRANDETSQEVPIALTPVIAKVVRVLIYCFKTVSFFFLSRFQLVVVKSEAKSNPVLWTMSKLSTASTVDAVSLLLGKIGG